MWIESGANQENGEKYTIKSDWGTEKIKTIIITQFLLCILIHLFISRVTKFDGKPDVEGWLMPNTNLNCSIVSEAQVNTNELNRSIEQSFVKSSKNLSIFHEKMITSNTPKGIVNCHHQCNNPGKDATNSCDSKPNF